MPVSEHLTDFAHQLGKALRNLVPIVGVVALFQLLVFRQMPEEPLHLAAAGLAIVVVGIALFLQGLNLSVFPVGRKLADEFVERRSL